MLITLNNGKKYEIDAFEFNDNQDREIEIKYLGRDGKFYFILVKDVKSVIN